MESPIIIFILLFVLVIILLFLQVSNKKFADKISILEQTLDMKADTITSLKETYIASRKILDTNATQIQEIEDQKQKLINFQSNKVSLEEIIRDKNMLLKQQQEMYEENVKDNRVTIENLKKESLAQNKNMDMLKQTYHNAMDDANKKYLSLEDTLHNKNNKNTELSMLLSRALVEVKEEKQQLKLLKEEFRQSDVEVKKNYANYEDKIRTKESEVSQRNIIFNELVEELKVNISNLEESNRKYVKTIESLEQEIDLKNNEHAHLQLEYDKNVQTTKINKSLLQQTILEQSTSITGLKKIITRLEEDVSTQVSMLSDLKMKYKETVYNSDNIEAGLQEKIDKINKIMESKTLKILELEDSNLIQIAAIDALEKSIILQRDENKTLQVQSAENKEKTNIDKKLSKQTIIEQSRYILELKANISHLEEGVSSQKSMVSTLKVKYQEMVNTYEKKELHLHDKLKIIEEQAKRDKQKLEDEVTQEREENINLSSQQEKTLLAYKKEHDLRVQTLEIHNKEIMRLEDEYRETQKNTLLKLEQNKKEIVRLNEERLASEKDKNGQIVLVNKALMQKHQEVLELTNQIQGFEKKSLDKKLRQQIALEDSKQLYVNLEQKSKKREQQLEEAYAGLENKLKLLEREIDSIQLKKEQEISSMKRSQKTIDVVNEKELETLELALNQEQSTSVILKKTVQIKEDIIRALKSGKEEIPLSIQSTVMDAVRSGKSKHEVAKNFNIPLKRVELIMKFDKIQHG